MKFLNKRTFFLISLIITLSLLTLTACSSATTTTAAGVAAATVQPATTTASSTATASSPAGTTATATPGASAGNYTINVAQNTTLGNYLVNGSGMTLYYFTKDSANTSSANASVIANWPVFYTPNINVPSSLNAASFGTITRTDGTKQTTFKDWPLYTYVKDTAPGDVKGEGVNDVWFVVNPDSFMPPKKYPLVNGWYQNQQVQYYDFGTNSALVGGKILTAPIYVLITGMDAQGNPQMVSGQNNIIDVIPGDTGYSDLWQVNLVTVPSDYKANTIRSTAEVNNSGYPVQVTDNLVNCPVVPNGSTTETGKALTKGWHKGRPIYYFDFGANTDTAAAIYAFITGMDAQGNPQFVTGQHNIIDAVPGNADYTAFWQVTLVTVPSGYTADTLRSFSAVTASGYPMQATDNIVNCPVVNGGTATITPAATATATPTTTTPAVTTSPPATTTTAAGQAVTIDLTAEGFAFDKSIITVPAGASVTILFTNMDNAPHNFALYTDSSAQTSIFVGRIITNSTATYTFTAPSTPGNYFFRCDVHPTMMTGTFIVQ